MIINHPIQPNKVIYSIDNKVEEVIILQKLKDAGYRWKEGNIIPNPQYFRRNDLPYDIFIENQKLKIISTKYTGNRFK